METFVDVGSNVPSRFEKFASMNLNDMEIPYMSSHGFNMSPNNIEQPSQGSDCKTCSSSSKRKRRGQNSNTVDVIKDVMACQTDQLRLIVEWPQLALEDESRVCKWSFEHCVPYLSSVG